MRRSIIQLLVAGALVAAGGCARVRAPSAAPGMTAELAADGKHQPPGQITRRQLQARLMGFADRYLNRLSEAVDTIEAKEPTAQCRLMGHSSKYYPGLSIVTLAAEPEPQVALLDMMVVVTLERMVWEGEWAEEVFHEHAPLLTAAQRDVENDIWSVAASVMTEDQLAQVRELIEEWRRQHPGRHYVSSTRFDDLARLRKEQKHAPLRGNLFAPVSEAARQVEETRLLGERAMFLATHMPVLFQWQGELFVNWLAVKPETQQLLTNSNNISQSVQKLAGSVERLPKDMTDQRAALVKELDERQASLRQLIGDARELAEQIRGIASDGNQLAGTVRETLAVADKVLARVERDPASTQPAGRPFDIREYSNTAAQLTITLKEMNQVLSATDQLAASPVWHQRLEEVEGATHRRTAEAGLEGRRLVDHMFWRGVAFVVIACAIWFISTLVYRWIIHRAIGPQPAAKGAMR